MPQKRYRPEEIIARLACQPGRDEALHRTGSPWENGHVESFSGKLRDELLNGGPFYGVKEAQILTQKWRVSTTACDRTAHLVDVHRRPRPWSGRTSHSKTSHHRRSHENRRSHYHRK